MVANICGNPNVNMISWESSMTRVLYVITCGSSSAPRVYACIEAAQHRGWNVCSILTPSARKCVDAERLEQMTGHPVRSE